MIAPRLAFVLAAAAAAFQPLAAAPGVDPLTARVDDSAARRFADLWKASDGNPSAERIQHDYLAPGGRGIEVFTPGRIVSAERLAGKIAARPAVCAQAVERCLPWIGGTNAQLRAAYLGLRGLLPDHALPRIAVVIGADNSGGTAGPGIQVIGLEVICRLSPTRAQFDARMRSFFAHETVHTFQPQDDAAAARDPLLVSALEEGVADYVAGLVTGEVPNAPRAAWAMPKEAWIWREFEQDRAIVKAGTDAKGDMNPAAQAAFRRWFGNADDPPAGWPGELGYWVGMRIAEAYVAQAADPHAAVEQLLNPAAASGILRDSHYGAGLER